jgi:ABC-type branched-subunit amino acid transport system substrate-binding protein
MQATTGRTLLALLAVALVAAGCGRDDEDDGGGGAAGAPAKVAGFDGKTIKLGVISALSGPAAVVGEPITAGNRLWFDYLNAERGGVGGKYKVQLVARDSRGDVPVSVQAYNRLKDEVAAFVQIYSTPATQAVLPALERDGGAASPASLDAAWVRERNLMPIAAPYQIQAANAMDYYAKTEGKGAGKRVCTMIEDDAYGEAGQDGVAFAGEQLGFEIATTAKFRPGDKDYIGQVTRLRKAACDIVFLVASVADVGAILGTAAQAKFAPRWIGQSPTWLSALAKSPLRPYLEARFWVVAEGPAWGDESVSGMRDLIARKQRYPPRKAIEDGDFYFTFGYIQARAVTTVLEQAVKNGDLSKAGILKAIEEVEIVELDGLAGDYVYGDAAGRSPGRESSIFAIDAGEPFGLKALKTNFSSDAAEAYEFAAK